MCTFRAIVRVRVFGFINNAWLAHGTPHLNVRSDFMDTETGIKPKHAYLVV
jgi:hypothetical protein